MALILILSSCAVVRAPEHTRIALFAPFEGRYREVGYNALYAARLALGDYSAYYSGVNVDLLPIDSGGIEAVNHAKALTQDPLVVAAVVLGYDGTSPETLQAFGDIPVLVVGDWGAKPTGDNVFILSNPQIDQQLTVSPRIDVTDAAALTAPIVGGDVFALEGFAKLQRSLDGVTVLSSGTLPDARTGFAERYKNGDPFTPEPGLLATLTHRATGMAMFWSGSGSRSTTRNYLAPDFPNGYWKDAEIHRYHYVNGSLTEDIVK
ncbi:MAG: hypothetical protein GC204_20335 [Chloroflexi bacterium]|nr:hypothetical protein [Chloroflexota bacterium]